MYNQKKCILEQNILYNKEVGISKTKYCDHGIIVSLTTYGKRLYEVHLAIESIMEQTMKANRIISEIARIVPVTASQIKAFISFEV